MKRRLIRTATDTLYLHDDNTVTTLHVPGDESPTSRNVNCAFVSSITDVGDVTTVGGSGGTVSTNQMIDWMLSKLPAASNDRVASVNFDDSARADDAADTAVTTSITDEPGESVIHLVNDELLDTPLHKFNPHVMRDPKRQLTSAQLAVGSWHHKWSIA